VCLLRNLGELWSVKEVVIMWRVRVIIRNSLNDKFQH